jgi:hypothetical protein
MLSITCCHSPLLLLIFYSIKSQEKKEKKFKIQENIHEEILEDYSSWWWKTKTTSGKVEGSKCIRLTKLAAQF